MVSGYLVLFVLALHQQAAQPLAMQVVTDKYSYVSGDTVRITVSLENRSGAPVVLARVLWDGAPAAGCQTEVTRNGARVETASGSTTPNAQVLVHPVVTEDRFLTLKPGQKVAVYREWFSEEREFHGHSARLKSSYRYATTSPLPPGTYTVRAKYAFTRGEKPHRWFDYELRFPSARAKQLYDSAWVGELSSEVTFQVVGTS